MARQIRWKELTTGIIMSLVVIGTVVSILLFARVGAIRGDKATLYVATGDVDGVIKGTEVWLSGQKIGEVKDVRFRSANSDTLSRLLVETEVLLDHLPHIRKNSIAQIGPGGNLIGSMVVFISDGTSDSPPLRSGDTIYVQQKLGVAGVTETFSRLMTNVAGLGSDVKELKGKVSSPNGTIGAFSRGGMPELGKASAEFGRLKNKAMNGRGTIGLAMRGGLTERAAGVMASVDSLRTFASSGSGNVGRFRRDSSLITTVKGIMAQVDSLRALAANPVGAISKARSDSGLARELQRTRAELDALMRDIKKRPLRYINF